MPRRTPPQTLEEIVADLAEEVRSLRRGLTGATSTTSVISTTVPTSESFATRLMWARMTGA